MHTMRRTQSKLADVVQNRVPAAVGATIMGELTAQYRDRYPAPPPESPRGPQRTHRFGTETESAPAEQRPRRRREEPRDDIDYSNRGLLR